MRSPAPTLLLALAFALAGSSGGASQPASPVQPGQVWRLDGVTADGEQFQTVLRLRPQPPAGQPLTYRADRGALLYDPRVPSLVALDTADAGNGGLALACVTLGSTRAPLSGVLISGPLPEVSARLKEAFAVASVARTPADLRAAARELRLGTCTLRRQ
ncbi:hypothetical protein [Deinococcus apachensis]|uniref:hypothetical protein n=1 Tax=Deinococcus apachensis TaxID=309886 RepID=UPI00037F307E|nr:hypothetical protein [Deinococcus apachensis]